MSIQKLLRNYWEIVDKLLRNYWGNIYKCQMIVILFVIFKSLMSIQQLLRNHWEIIGKLLETRDNVFYG